MVEITKKGNNDGSFQKRKNDRNFQKRKKWQGFPKKENAQITQKSNVNYFDKFKYIQEN
jgi:hypothetical protein